ncbi:branched-chain amino acid ABC transporter substrate-binding protein [Paenalcaligenes niemegkensis]|uniref:branched-chain amino acid ABC transporter substrate-binding protein n=1 Tax=Paenalcaligenes niemegkensis TaxID=2895469 RepID=UPI001EE985BC|nr:branched-chain amino acid ABC transporter substrate-binding protein [Paenalcaligenes niemegkensis]MCQ9615352.1 branched-chain amino acid ABC transporter substrate-binding protein [Paenalcaligenes niemegkensis]
MEKRFGLRLLALGLSMAMPFSLYANDTVKIGIAGPFTGANAAFGDQLWTGATAAAEAINTAGGIDGKQIQLVKADDACEPKQAVAVANRLVDQDKVVAVIGHFCSSSTLPASEIYDEADILSMATGSTHPDVTERGLPTVTRICGRDDQQATVIGDFISNTLKAKRIAVIHDKDTYGRGLAEATRGVIKDLGTETVLFDGVTRGERDYNALVTRIRAANVDAVFFGGLYAEAGTLVRQIREQGMTIPYISDDGIVDPAFVTAAGGAQYANGVYMGFPRDPRNMESSKPVIAKLESEGKKADGFTLYAYAGVEAVSAAIAGAKSHSGTELAEWLQNNRVDTVLGPKEWDSKGDLKEPDYVMYQWDEDGGYAELN